MPYDSTDCLLLFLAACTLAAPLAVVSRLQSAGISYDDAIALRRISMTLHRWHELECGDGNSYGSWAIVRGRKDFVQGELPNGEKKIKHEFVHDDDGKPYLEHHHYRHGQGKDYTSYTPLADKERGALKRLDKILARYPGFVSYVQGDPRGCALYILTRDVVVSIEESGSSVETSYNRGIAVYK